MNTEDLDIHTYVVRPPTEQTNLGTLKCLVKDMTSAVDKIVKRPADLIEAKVD